MANELAEKKESFSVALTNSLNEVQNALPVGFNTSRFVQNAVALLNDNEGLQAFAKKNGTAQIKAGLLKAATLGLDAMSKECYLVPYSNTLTFMPSYIGNVKLCKKYSIRKIKDIYAKLVREGDDFEESIVNGEQTINFKPKPFNNGEIIGAFAVCLYADGGVQYDTMSLADLENTRKASKASNSPAWTKFTGEMYKKTVLHRLCKHIEIDFDSLEQRNYFYEDTEIETDVRKSVENDIQQNANAVEFEDDVVEVVDGSIE